MTKTYLIQLEGIEADTDDAAQAVFDTAVEVIVAVNLEHLRSAGIISFTEAGVSEIGCPGALLDAIRTGDMTAILREAFKHRLAAHNEKRKDTAASLAIDTRTLQRYIKGET